MVIIFIYHFSASYVFLPFWWKLPNLSTELPPTTLFFFFFLEQMARSLFQITSTRKLLFLPHVCMCEYTMFHIFA